MKPLYQLFHYLYNSIHLLLSIISYLPLPLPYPKFTTLCFIIFFAASPRSFQLFYMLPSFVGDALCIGPMFFLLFYLTSACKCRILASIRNFLMIICVQSRTQHTFYFQLWSTFQVQSFAL